MGQIDISELRYDPGASARLFILFLFVAVCIILVRMIRMAWCLWSLRRKQDFSSYASRDVEKIAKAALKGLLKGEPKLSNSETLTNLPFIETKFLFLWETFHARIQSTKTLAALTVVLSFSVAAFVCTNICNALMAEANVGIEAIADALHVVFTLLATGLFVSTSFYLFALLFEGTLFRRRRDWNYFRARMSEASCSNNKEDYRHQSP